MGIRYNFTQVKVEIMRGSELVASFGENKSMVGSITFSRANDRFSVEGDSTGGYIVNETLDKTGEVVISIRQFAPLVKSLTSLFKKYDTDSFGWDSNNQGAVTITASFQGKKIAVATGAFLNMAELAYEEEASDRDFTFVAGEVNFEEIPAMRKIG